MAVYTAIDDPEAYFQAKLYSGTGSQLAVTLDGDTDMQPDFVWFKNRGTTNSHGLQDSVRGFDTTGIQSTNGTDADPAFDGSTLGYVSAVGSDGFTVEAGNCANASSNNYVAWCWKAGTAFSNDASATSIGTIDSSGSASDTAGFSIVSYTGNATNGATVAHGLSSAPQMVITKNRADAGTSWQVLTNIYPSYSEGDYIYLSSTQAKANSANVSFLPTSTTWQMESGQAGNVASTQIAYCFAEKQGFSKFGSYTSNFSSDGVFVYLGFRPAFVMVKSSSAAGTNWVIHDNKRHSVTPASGGTNFNVINRQSMPNLNNADDTNDGIDFLSNGFKWRWTGGDVNSTAGRTYIYMAFAEAPFVNSNGVPCNAR